MHLGELLCTHHPNLVFLMETRVGPIDIDKIKQRHDMYGLTVVSEGRSGGLALLWDKSSSVTVQRFSKYHIDASVQLEGQEETWRFTSFYGEPDTTKRNHTWTLLKKLAAQSQTGSLCLGDSNEVLSPTDKRGGALVPEWRMQAFRQTLSHCGLVELEFEVYQYTCMNKHEEETHIEIRLDKGVASHD